MILKLVPMLKIAGAVSALAGVAFLLKVTYDAGYASARNLHYSQIVEVQQQAVERARAEWELANAAGQTQAEAEKQIVERIRYVERDIPVVVDRIVRERPDCVDLGPDFLRLFNEAIAAPSGRGTRPAAPVLSADGPVPGAGPRG
jgi:hypothetical protein